MIDLAGLCTGDGPCVGTPLSASKGDNWVARAGGFPPYMRAIIRGVRSKSPSMSLSEAVRLAWGILRRFAKGIGCTKATQARAAAALADLEAKQAKSHDHTREATMGNLDLAMSAKMRSSAPVQYPGTNKFPIRNAGDFAKAWALRGNSTIPKAKVEAWLRGVANRFGYKIPGDS